MVNRSGNILKLLRQQYSKGVYSKAVLLTTWRRYCALCCRRVQAGFEFSRWVKDGISKATCRSYKKIRGVRKKRAIAPEKESQLNRTTVETNKKAKELIAKEKSLNVQTYRFYLDVLGSGHCKTAYVTEMGQDFWEENLDELILAGAQIGKDEHAVKQEISYAMVDIFGA